MGRGRKTLREDEGVTKVFTWENGESYKAGLSK